MRSSVTLFASKRVLPIALAITVPGLAACARLLGIEDAVCAPELDAECPDPVRGMASAQPGVNADGATEAVAGDRAVVDAGASGSTASCARYCSIVNGSCTGPDQQYASDAACLAVCGALPWGGATDGVSGNTVQCRLMRAELAGTTGEPSDYCYAAGPGGGGVCGSNCEGYCALMTATCSELGSLRECLDACAAVPDLSKGPSMRPAAMTIQSGNTLQCRLFHVSAATLDPSGHCAHAAGLEACVDPL